ncbi:MAG: site-specific integrase [Planctomycetes bacterium]|nr:site-specific integrase [Planctomycetota bacterium]
MPWSNNHLPKYRKHRASSQAIVTLSGQDFYLGPHGTKASKLEYDRVIGEWPKNGLSPLLGSADGLTVVELWSRYWKFAKSYYKKDGKCTGEAPNIKAAIRFLRDWYGKTLVSEFGPLALQAVRQRMVEADFSRNYVNAQIGRIKRMFKWGVAEELVPPAVFQGLTSVTGLRQGRSDARESEPVMPVEDTIVQTTLTALSQVVGDMVRLQRLTGMRPAEVCQLQPVDIDREGDVWLYQPSQHKTQHHGRERTVFFGPQAQGILLRYLARSAEEYCFQPRDSEAKRLAALHAARTTPMSCGNRPGSNRRRKPKKKPGNHYTTDSYRRAIHYACDKAGIEKWSPNRLRHSAATEVRSKFGLEAAQIILGHSTADVTQVYAERDLTKGIEVARQIG